MRDAPEALDSRASRFEQWRCDAAFGGCAAVESLSVAHESYLGVAERVGSGLGLFALFGVEVQDEGRAGAVLRLVGDGGVGSSFGAWGGVGERSHFSRWLVGVGLELGWMVVVMI